MPRQRARLRQFRARTFVASEVGANTNNGEGVAGAGWNTSLGIFKVCYQEIVTDGVNVFLVGLCPLSASAEAIMLAASDQFDAANNLTRSQYHVITMSYGSDLVDPVTGEVTPSAPPNTECDAILYAWNHGVVVVAGAGNNGDTNKFYPAACTDDPASGTGQSTVIAVAASDHDDNRASFSTYSTDADDWVSVAAPGEAIVGVLPDAHCELPSGADTCVNWLDGTSMATPLVAAGAALMWADLYQSGAVDGAPAPSACTAGGTPCNQVVRGRIETGADKVGARGQDLLQWTRHGRLNLANALTVVVPPPTGTTRVTIRASVPLAAEAGLATGRLTVQRTGSTDEALPVHVTITGTATPGTDYVPLPDTVTIPAGAASADIDVVPLDDALFENNETVTMSVAPDPAYLPGVPSSATVVVTSDDLPPDLVVASLTVPTKAGAGAAINVSDTTRNQGEGAAGPSTTALHLSTDGTLDAADALLGSRIVPALAPGESSSATTTVTIPAGTTPGTYWLIARADAAGAVAESQESNNIIFRSLRIGPDLTMASLDAPTSAESGGTIPRERHHQQHRRRDRGRFQHRLLLLRERHRGCRGRRACPPPGSRTGPWRAEHGHGDGHAAVGARPRHLLHHRPGGRDGSRGRVAGGQQHPRDLAADRRGSERLLAHRPRDGRRWPDHLRQRHDAEPGGWVGGGLDDLVLPLDRCHA
jgi:hypothetical protein